jgi:hypothetical protein
LTLRTAFNRLGFSEGLVLPQMDAQAQEASTWLIQPQVQSPNQYLSPLFHYAS